MKNSLTGYSPAPNLSDAIVIGSGIAGLTTACLLARDGFEVTVLERNWLPGGCASSYPRKGYMFESGATTLVGLSEGMPFYELCKRLGIAIPAEELEVPMQVFLPNGQQLIRFKDLKSWITEAERVFGRSGQRAFWEFCYEVSQFVWQTSLRQQAFPPSNWKDVWQTLKSFQPKQLKYARWAFRSVEDLLRKFNLHEHTVFRAFVNEQLLITAQNYADEVNVLFGATALCYTLYPNYYIKGGLIELVKPMVQFIEERGGQVILRAPVTKVEKNGNLYRITTAYRKKTDYYTSQKLVSAIPVNNTLSLFQQNGLQQSYQKQILTSPHLHSAFQIGLVFKKRKHFSCLHHQIHLEEPLPFIRSNSIFLSLSHPDDSLRCASDEVVASVSTHVSDPANNRVEQKEVLVEAIIQVLVDRGFFHLDDVVYQHASTPHTWEKWTGRKWGFVGGYPQYMHIKPWQMIDARLDHRGAYICGDSTYPGQGIPGACLSGMIAYEKMRIDGM